jgi:hypothetical protein
VSAFSTALIASKEIPQVFISVRVLVTLNHSNTKGIETATFRLEVHCFTQRRRQLNFRVEVAIHVLSIFAQGEKQESFYIQVSCTGAKTYRTVVWGGGWVGHSGDQNCYREFDGSRGLRTRGNKIHHWHNIRDRALPPSDLVIYWSM